MSFSEARVRPALILLLCLTLVVGACGQVPQPFRPGQKNAAVSNAPGPSTALVVADIGGADAVALDSLTNRLVRALQKAEIAATRALIANRYQLVGEVQRLRDDGPDTIFVFRWWLLDPEGETVDSVSHTIRSTARAWTSADPATIETLAERASAHVIRLINGDLPIAEPPAPEARIALGPFTGAPGDGNQALNEAMRTALIRRGLLLGPESAATRAVLELHVAVAPADQTTDQVTLLWLIRDADGRERGRLEQQNTVPAGRLSGRWGDVATLAAGGAAPDLARILAALADTRQ
ncbi:MAG: hypothetical protein P1U65_12565 [Minwuia sp.]|nr:hypothetical protein [Minwuia sp.]